MNETPTSSHALAIWTLVIPAAGLLASAIYDGYLETICPAGPSPATGQTTLVAYTAKGYTTTFYATPTQAFHFAIMQDVTIATMLFLVARTVIYVIATWLTGK